MLTVCACGAYERFFFAVVVLGSASFCEHDAQRGKNVYNTGVTNASGRDLNLFCVLDFCLVVSERF